MLYLRINIGAMMNLRGIDLDLILEVGGRK